MTDACPSFRRLIDHHDGLLSPGHTSRLERHFAEGCEHCRAERDFVEKLISSIAEGPLPKPPRNAVRRAKALLPDRPPLAERVFRKVARLLFDESLDPAPALRSTVGTTRRILFGTEEREIFLTLTSRRGSWRLDGQVLAAGDGVDLSGRVTAVRGSAPGGRSIVKAEGRFRIAEVRPGTWHLRGVAGGEEFETPEFVLA